MTRQLSREIILAIHAEQIAEHGGAPGIRDIGLMDSALARPRNREAYGDADLCALAAALGHGLARNHPFIDGNKRTAFVAVELFLELNGLELTAGDVACVIAMLGLAEGTLPEAEFAAWLRTHSRAAAAGP